MRAPPLARIVAVAAPRPDAEPVTIAHNPSFDIGISSDDFQRRDAIYHIVRRSARKSATLLHAASAGALAEIGACIGGGFSSSCRARKTAPNAGRKCPVRCADEAGSAVAESENIVAETAERIFADLADPQTVNRDKSGGWKAPLWRALTEAGLPLSWVDEDCGGAGASLAEGFGVLSATGRFSLAVPLAET